ncbi:hypothetical protein CASFOL_006003 [Castilleja foliolosa]|uniref:Uncharacterized protein n=1 Tax=Castilleja foliolosa TaxID=1961234 RepID=A0ABD3E916_9LAMI
MDKENSSRRRRESDSHRDRETSKDHHRRSKHDEDRRRSDEHYRGRSDSKTEREGSRDRDTRRERERSHSVERKKRKERGESEERSDKRSRVSEGNGKGKRRFEDVNVEEDGRKGKRDESLGFEGISVKKEVADENEYRSSRKRGESSSVANQGKGVATETITTLSSTSPETSVAHSHAPTTILSSITITNENERVVINRSHEVPGNSSPVGTTSDVGKSGGFSRDVLAKAKRAVQKHKELEQKMKKIPALNRDAGSTGGSARGGLKEVAKVSSSNKSGSTMPVPPVSASVVPDGVEPGTSKLNFVTSTSVTPSQSGLPHLPGLTTENVEAVKRAQELAANMGFRQDPEFGPLINMFPGQMHPEVTIQPKPSKAPVLRLDALGREVDEHGNVVNVPKVNSLSTLKVNINKQKKEAFQILKPELDVDPDKNPHFDARMGIDKNKLLRPKKNTFQFVDEGKWSKEAEIIKLKSQFGEAKAKELKAKEAQLTKAKGELDINPNLIEVGERVITKEKRKESIPDVEWWDMPFLQSGTYDNMIVGEMNEENIKMEKITIYVEHPRPIEPPAEAAPPPPQPLTLTKKEQKKLRTQRRLAREKERQEMIRLGVLEPPKPKVKMSNLMKVLGSEATQDPTRLEMEIRSAAAEREKAHIDRNVARKLTPAERREKKERKLFDDPNALDIIVSVYKINDLSHPQARFKVDINAQENRMTGCAIISEGISVVVVEGGAKSIKRYGKLMLKRINWTSAINNEEDENDEEKPLNKCVLVWQGSVAKQNFNRFFVQECRTETAARRFFSDHGVAHYWDLAVNFTEDTM